MIQRFQHKKVLKLDLQTIRTREMHADHGYLRAKPSRQGWQMDSVEFAFFLEQSIFLAAALGNGESHENLLTSGKSSIKKARRKARHIFSKELVLTGWPSNNSHVGTGRSRIKCPS